MGAAWGQHGIFELALILPFLFTYFSIEVYFPADFNLYKHVFTCLITHIKVLLKLILYVFFINYALKFNTFHLHGVYILRGLSSHQSGRPLNFNIPRAGVF
jgi:hypothetical protein